MYTVYRPHRGFEETPGVGFVQRFSLTLPTQVERVHISTFVKSRSQACEIEESYEEIKKR